MEIVLATNDLVKTYGNGVKAVHALQGINLTVAPGEIFGLLGPNGAGKTTLIKCALGIVFATSGSGSLLGYPFGSVEAKAHIGYLPENHRYPLYLTGEQVLSYFGKLSGVPKERLQQRIEETLKVVGMTEWRKTKVRKYSKGMMQRLGLAQALINDPKLIMLDEPTDGVDPVGRKEIRDVLTHLKDEGRTIFLNSHLLSEVEQVSDRVAIMDHGRIIREGRVQDLTRVGNIYELQIPNYQPAMLDGLSAKVIRAEGSSIEIACDSPNDLNQAIDKLRGVGATIEGVIPKKVSLEDVFVNLIKTSEVTHQ
jgi:ABC-2 type transport system ATP-binding protein